MYLKEGEYSNECKIVTHFANETVEDIYTVIGYYYTKDTKNIYVKNRAVIVEKTTQPSVLLFYYPQMYEYELPLISDEDNNYFSHDLMYLIQKRGTTYKVFNIVGYNEPQEFIGGFPESINQENIVDFEFLKDTLLIFTNDKNNPVIGINLNKLCGVVENVSDINTSYDVTFLKYNILGKNNEGVIAKLSANIEI